LVGQEDAQEWFIVHRALLMARSKFFKKALSGDWNEAKKGIVELPTDDPIIFAIYTHAIYTSGLAILPDPLPAGYTGLEEFDSLCLICIVFRKNYKIWL
jgi:hypothetical protein